jgi:hypothetical protein
VTTPNKLAANRRNALRSTGPRTPYGKAVVSQNGVRHGLLASYPVIPRLESAALWHEHRLTTVESFAPIGPVETALAERVALILWRLRRVATFEQDTIHRARERAFGEVLVQHRPLLPLEGVDTIDDVLDRLTEARTRLRAFQRLANGASDAPLAGRHADLILTAIAEQLDGFDLDSFSAPDLVPDNVAWVDVPDWSVERLCRLVEAIAHAAERHPDQLIAAATDAAREALNRERAAQRRFDHQVRELRAERALPEPAHLDRILRYENHLTRQLNQTLTQLRALQQARQDTTSQDTPEPLESPMMCGTETASTVPPLPRAGEGVGG